MGNAETPVSGATDVFARSVTPPRYRPGIGLRPGGERPDIEALVPVFYAALYESVAGHPGREGTYVTSAPDGTIPEVVHRWQREVHRPGIYDLEVDTSTATPGEIADAIGRRLRAGPATSFTRLGGSA